MRSNKGLLPWREWMEQGDDYAIPPKKEWPSAGSTPKANPPNIIYVLQDDWGFNDPGFRSTYANFTTPTIDGMKNEGVLLDRFYTYHSCSPSRAMLFTGRYANKL